MFSDKLLQDSQFLNRFRWKILFVCFLITPIDGAKILCLLPLGGSSTAHVFNPLIEKLASNGHHLTAIWSLQPQHHKSKNIRDIVIAQTPIADTKTMTGIYGSVSASSLSFLIQFKDFITGPCELYYRDKQVQELLKEGKQFDVVIVSGFMNECALTTASLLGNSTIWFVPNMIFSWTPFFVPRPPSIISNSMLPYTTDMDFFQRIHNTFYAIAVRIIHDYYLMPAIDAIVAKHVAEALTTAEALSKIDFVLTNVDPVIISPRPLMPNIVNVGGLHCTEPKPLPKELEDFVQGSKNSGFILFSFGTNAQSRHLPAATRNAFINALSRLKQRVIWKYEGELEDLPSNIKIFKWIPQQDLLGHPKIRLFITHGGLLSLQQSVYHAVPTVGIPLFSDQHRNVARLETLHIGRQLKFTDITADSVYETIMAVLEDKQYTINVRHYSSIFRDRPQHPLDTATFWVEYVIRHKGASHLACPGKQLNFFQYFSLDVILFAFCIISLAFCLAVVIKTMITIVTYKELSEKPKLH